MPRWTQKPPRRYPGGNKDILESTKYHSKVLKLNSIRPCIFEPPGIRGPMDFTCLYIQLLTEYGYTQSELSLND